MKQKTLFPKRPKSALAQLWNDNMDLKAAIKRLKVQRDNLLRLVGRKAAGRG